jgi:hypothetical protein
MKRLLRLFGYYHFDYVNKALTEVKREEDVKMYELSKKIMAIPFKTDARESSLLANQVATEVASTNPLGEFFIKLVNGD